MATECAWQEGGTSKMKLISFTAELWQQPQQIGQRTVFIINGEKCVKVEHNSVSDVVELTSTQEEADTQILLNAKHVVENYSSAIIFA